MAYVQNQRIPFPNDGTVLVASNKIAASTQTAGLEVDTGRYDVVVDVTDFELGVSYDTCIVYVEANSADATTTWQQLPGALVLGDAAGAGPLLSATGTFKLCIDNQKDSSIRLNIQFLGSTQSLTYSAKVYPLRDRVGV